MRLYADALPDRIKTVEELDEVLSRPGDEVVEDMARVEGGLLVLGGSGKVGPTLRPHGTARGPAQAGGRRGALQRSRGARTPEFVGYRNDRLRPVRSSRG